MDHRFLCHTNTQCVIKILIDATHPSQEANEIDYYHLMALSTQFCKLMPTFGCRFL